MTTPTIESEEGTVSRKEELYTPDYKDVTSSSSFLQSALIPASSSFNMETDDDDNNNCNLPYWSNEDGFIDDNMPKVESDCSEYAPSESPGCLISTNESGPITYSTSTAMPSSENIYSPERQHDAAINTKFYPNEMLLCPPSSSTLNYNYSQSRHIQQCPQTNYKDPPINSRTSSYASASNLSQHQHSNMWYPNASYRISSSGYCDAYETQLPPRYHPYGVSYANDPMMLQMSNSGREARNRAEKNRRDKLNNSIQDLSTMVPHVAESSRRVDKTAVLRFAAHGLRLQYVFGETLNQHRPQITDSLMKLMDSFFITLTCHGQIVLVSSSIEQHLGHCQADLYGQNILNLTHPEDHNMLKQQLIPTDLENIFDIHPIDESGEIRIRTQAEEEHIDKRLREDKRSFTVRLARAGPRSEPTNYEIVKFDGNFRRSDWAPRGIKPNTFPSSLQLIRKSRGRDDAIPLRTISGNDIVLIAIVRIVRPPKIISNFANANKMEYKTRHLIDGRIIDCDQRIGIVAGYMTNEVRNLSPFTFIHQNDVRWVIVSLRQMYDCNSSFGESAYRLLTRNGKFIYLHSKGFLEIEKETNKVHSFVCVNTMLDEEEGRRRIREMKNKFSIIINTKIPQSSVDAPASENPQQLEKAVLCLIHNLQNSSSSDHEDECNLPSYSNYCNKDAQPESLSSLYNDCHKTAIPHNRVTSMQNKSSSSIRSAQTPPLALVPPEASSVRNSISKSVSIVNDTAAKHLRVNQTIKSPTWDHMQECQSGSAVNQNVINEEHENQCLSIHQSKPTYVKRTLICSENHDIKAPKQRFKSTEIEKVISSSFSEDGDSIQDQLNEIVELDEITAKRQKQNEEINVERDHNEMRKQNETIEANEANVPKPQIANDMHNKSENNNTLS